MISFLRQLRAEIAAIFANPSRLRRLADPKAIRRVTYRLLNNAQNTALRAPWQEGRQAPALASRRYRSYATYIRHQSRKLRALELERYQRRFREALGRRLPGEGRLPRGSAVLCLGARLGAEVAAFHDRGHLAIGVDLNPGAGNPYVLPGDFHDLVFPSTCFDCVYTNTIDHVLDLDRLLAEVDRVLRPDGRLLIEVAESAGRGEYETLAWSDLEALLAEFERRGWRERERMPFDYPWPGWQIELERPGE